MEVVELNRGNGTVCKIHLFGATLTSWAVENNELIFVSKNAIFNNKKAIRGGIPFCFPVFGPHASLPQHGFARTSLWSVATPPTATPSGDVSTVLTLKDSEETRAVWPHSFTLSYTVTLTENQLKLQVDVVNKNSSGPLDFTICLHTYIKVDHVEKAAIQGLKALKFVDKTKEGAPTADENRDEVALSEFTDRVYLNSPAVQTVKGVSGGGSLELSKSGLPDTVVWNPWPEKAGAMADLGADQWEGFLCVEAGQCVTPVEVQSGATWTATHTLKYVKE